MENKDMLTWMEPCIIDEDIKKPEKIRKKLDRGKLQLGIYLISLSSNPHNYFEIFSAAELMIPARRELCPPIIGMAKNKDKAIEMIMEIVDSSMQTEYKTDFINFIKNR